MHMADALISPVVGGAMLVAAGGVSTYSIKKIKEDLDEKKIPLMGVMGAFVFAVQMINFTIPMTGSSGHLGGGILLSILLGPYAGFLTIVSILVIQALFFADGGLLALGCNIINLGFFSCFVAYSLIYKKIIKRGHSKKRLFIASLLSSVIGLQLAAFSVVLETFFSGKTELPFGTFVLLMQPIHLAIGVVEGLVTAALAGFVWKARPEIIENAATGKALGTLSIKKVLIFFIIAALFTGMVLSWFASSKPDGLEWSVLKTSDKKEPEVSGGIHKTLEDVQDKTALLPDYGYKASGEKKENTVGPGEEKWPAVSGGTSTAGLVGGLITLVLAGLTGLAISVFKKKKKIKSA